MKRNIKITVYFLIASFFFQEPGLLASEKKVYDYLIRNAFILDGEKIQGVRADVLIAGDKILKIGDLSQYQAREVIDAKNLTLTPGFIDAHTHSDFNPFVYPNLPNKVLQGVTTEITGNCGMSAAPVLGTHGKRIKEIWAREGVKVESITWKTFKEYTGDLQWSGLMNNMAGFVGHGNLRSAVMGYSSRPATQSEIQSMKKMLAQAMKEGASGISFGLIYLPGIFANQEELVELCREAGKKGGACSFHLRSEGAQLLEAIQEAIQVGEKAKTGIQISHLKAAGKGSWDKTGEAFKLIEDARLKKGQRIGADVYPYIGSFAELGVILPDDLYQREDRVEYFRNPLNREELLAKLRAYYEERKTKWDSVMIAATPHRKFYGYEGKTIREIAREKNLEPEAFLIDLLGGTSFEVSAFYFSQSEQVVRQVIRQSFTSIGSDNIADGSRKPHPRAFGTFPRILGEYVRHQRLIPLGEAVRKMTALPAEQFSLKNRGKIKEGYFADLVIFDAEEVKDRATYEEPDLAPAGIPWVFVNGKPVVKNGEYTGMKNGRFLSPAK